ncbi:hypothetical protein CR513_00369, partial [Mucuna pruriens]
MTEVAFEMDCFCGLHNWAAPYWVARLGLAEMVLLAKVLNVNFRSESREHLGPKEASRPSAESLKVESISAQKEYLGPKEHLGPKGVSRSKGASRPKAVELRSTHQESQPRPTPSRTGQLFRSSNHVEHPNQQSNLGVQVSSIQHSCHITHGEACNASYARMEKNDRTLKELATPDVVYQPWCIQYPQLEPAQTYELKSCLIHLLPKFHVLAGEDPHKHLKEFHVVYSTMRPQGIPEDYIMMKAFSLSLDGAAKDWLYLQLVLFNTLGDMK